MILVDKDILAAREAGNIVIEPFDRAALGTNSYDVHLGSTLLTYRGIEKFNPVTGRTMVSTLPLDCKVEQPTEQHAIGDDGFVLEPHTLYLASTVEYTESHEHVPFLEGKSSLGRLGLSIHVTAGKGDVGFRGHWTMEMTVVHPLRVYAGMPVGQLIWFQCSRSPEMSYSAKKSAKYGNRDPLPQPSRMWKNFLKA